MQAVTDFYLLVCLGRKRNEKSRKRSQPYMIKSQKSSEECNREHSRSAFSFSLWFLLCVSILLSFLWSFSYSDTMGIIIQPIL